MRAMEQPQRDEGNASERPVAISATRRHPNTEPTSEPAPSARFTQTELDAALQTRRRSRRFAALQASKGPTSADLRALVGERLRDPDGRQLGRIAFVEAAESLSEVWVVVEENRGGRRFYIPADQVDGRAGGGAYTDLRRGEIAASATIARGRLDASSEKLLRRHYASSRADRGHFSELLERERTLRKARAALNARDRRRRG